ncbi:unnamed protein product [Caenorhabditis sp. 36 PRJEB53466]|nr:unnamed protein product [Caenorhabditis sp. 36 PRJEB53466]
MGLDGAKVGNVEQLADALRMLMGFWTLEEQKNRVPNIKTRILWPRMDRGFFEIWLQGPNLRSRSSSTSVSSRWKCILTADFGRVHQPSGNQRWIHSNKEYSSASEEEEPKSRKPSDEISSALINYLVDKNHKNIQKLCFGDFEVITVVILRECPR